MRDNPVSVTPLNVLSDDAQLRQSWNALAGGMPFRNWDWLQSWWRCYRQEATGASGRREPLVLAVMENGRLIGGAPWYRQQSATAGNVIRFLGDGEVCSDYQGVLAQVGRERDVAAALSAALVEPQSIVAASPENDSLSKLAGWDLLEFNGIDARDLATHYLLNALTAADCRAHWRRGPTCWRIELPGTWEEYLARLSRSHRKQILRMQRRYLDSGRARLLRVNEVSELPAGLEILADLHQKRRASRGERGCFSLPRFARFFHDVSCQQQRAGQLELHWIELDGQPIAAEYHIVDGNIVYAYQSGIEPAALACEPGRMITIALLKRAITLGRSGYDLLRGDEQYKAHWRAQARPSHNVRVICRSGRARLRHSLWLAGGSLKSWLKTGLGMAGIDGIPATWHADGLTSGTAAISYE